MRGFKKVLYAFLYLILWSGLLAGGYFWYLRPNLASCVNNQKDYNETGVDCGGVCAKVCIPDLLPLEVAAVSVLPLAASPNDASILVELRNANPDHGAIADLNVSLFSSSEVKLGSETRSVRLAPGDISFVGLPAVRASASIARAEGNLKVLRWVTSSTLRKLNLAVNILEVSEKSGGVEVKGTLVNNDAAVAEETELIARFYGPDGALLGISATVLDRVLPREARPFSILHPAIPGILPDRTSIVAAAYSIQ